MTLFGNISKKEYNMEDEISRHTLYKELCKLSYNDKKMQNEFDVVDTINRDGYNAYCVRIGNNIIIVSRGTEIDDGFDLQNDVAMKFNKIPHQLHQALLFFDKQQCIFKNKEINVIGHSLGGTIAEHVGIMRKCKEVVAFNPYGNTNTMEKYILKYGIRTPVNKIINYCMSGDVISNVNISNNIGRIYKLENSTIHKHLLEFFPNLSSRILIQYTREIHTNNNLKYRILKKLEDVFDINVEKDDYKFFRKYGKHKPITMKSSINNEIDKCIGTYHVNGYKRKDGTIVSDYERTCGAKHKNILE